MDQVFEASGAIDKPALKALCRRSDARGLAQLAGHLLAILASGALVAAARGSPWLAPALVLHGTLLVFLFAPLHETIHATAFRSRPLNRAVAFLCGLVLFLPSQYFRDFHFAHHRHTQDPSADPELARPKPETLGGYLLALSGLPYWREQALLLARLTAGRVDESFVPPQRRAAVVREARVMVALYGAIAAASLGLGSAAALIYWLGPLALGQPALRAFLMAEHIGCPLVPDMLRNTRTTRSNPAVRWLAWRMNYHVEHHAYPALPFHALPKAHRLLRDKISVKSNSYIDFHWKLVRQLAAARPPRLRASRYR
jgi:fatty acid desaturase